MTAYRLAFSDEEQMFGESARGFAAAALPLAQLRGLRDTGSLPGYDTAAWREIAALGWAAIPWHEADGGLGLGYRALGVVTMEAGRTLAATPLFATVWLGGTAIAGGANAGVRQSLLSAVATGNLLLALAIDEGAHHRPDHIATTARRDGTGFVLNGSKTVVLDGHIADRLVIVTRTAGDPADQDGITLFLVPRMAPGVIVTRLEMVDSRNAARIELQDVRVPADLALGTIDQGRDLLDRVLDTGRIGLAAEMMGSAQECFDRSIAYLKERHQFGVPIGTFQALQHRAAQLHCELEFARSCVIAALTVLDDPARQSEVARLAALAKTQAGETFVHVAQEAIQFHGGYGMTDDCDIGFFLKRAAVTQHLLGDPILLRRAFARHTAASLASAATERISRHA